MFSAQIHASCKKDNSVKGNGIKLNSQSDTYSAVMFISHFVLDRCRVGFSWDYRSLCSSLPSGALISRLLTVLVRGQSGHGYSGSLQDRTAARGGLGWF